jgi:hypothetical protein
MRFAMSALSANRMAAGLLLLSALVSSTFAARVEDIEYSKIGWWSISYTKLDDLSYCRAMASFDQGTVLEMALFQKGGQGWVVSISNPTWKAWMVKNRRHNLRLETTLPPDPRTRLPPGFSPLGPTRVVTFSLSDDNTSLVFVGASIDFMNSIADAKSLEIFDENRTRLLTSLDMKHSAAAIQAVVKCVREPPAQTVSRLPGWWTGKRPPMPMNYASQDFNAKEIFRIVAPSVYLIIAGRTQEADKIGSAVAVAADTALTNCHVIENQALIMVLDEATTEPLKARVSNADRSSDRCFLKIDGGSLNPIAAVRRFKDLSVGERVYTIGNPSGLSKTMGEGLISGLREHNDIRYVQTTAPISGGSSGGALVDSKGALVGITSFLLKDAQNLNFAIAAEDYWH